MTSNDCLCPMHSIPFYHPQPWTKEGQMKHLSHVPPHPPTLSHPNQKPTWVYNPLTFAIIIRIKLKKKRKQFFTLVRYQFMLGFKKRIRYFMIHDTTCILTLMRQSGKKTRGSHISQCKLDAKRSYHNNPQKKCIHLINFVAKCFIS